MTCVLKKTIFKDDVCRLCATIGDKMVYIFDNAGSNVSRVIKQCFPALEVKDDDSKPKKICSECNAKLNGFHEFLTLCLESDIKFDTYIEQSRQQEEVILTEAVSQSCSIANCVWTDGVPKVLPQTDALSGEGVIVLSNMDGAIKTASIQDYVVTIEVKYKDNLPDIAQISPASATVANDISNAIENYSQGATKVNILSSGLETESNSQVCDNTIITYEKLGDSTLNAQICEAVNSCNPDPSTSNISSTDKKKSFECPVCQQVFLRRTRLNSHMSSHTDVRPHVCSTCGKSFPMRWYLNLHQRIHTGAFACPVCQKAFSSKGKLERHSRVHTGERPFVCSECGKGFGEKRNLDNHLRTHTGEKPFLCPICSRGFSVRSHVTDHLVVHKLKPGFECPHCNKKFKWKNNYNRHIKTHKTS